MVRSKRHRGAHGGVLMALLWQWCCLGCGVLTPLQAVGYQAWSCCIKPRGRGTCCVVRMGAQAALLQAMLVQARRATQCCQLPPTTCQCMSMT